MIKYDIWCDTRKSHTAYSLSFALLMAFKEASGSPKREAQVWSGSSYVATVTTDKYPPLNAESIREEITKCAA